MDETLPEEVKHIILESKIKLWFSIQFEAVSDNIHNKIITLCAKINNNKTIHYNLYYNLQQLHECITSTNYPKNAWACIINHISIDTLIYMYEHYLKQWKSHLSPIFICAYHYNRHDIINKLARYISCFHNIHDPSLMDTILMFFVMCREAPLLWKYVNLLIEVISAHQKHGFMSTIINNIYCDDDLIIYILTHIYSMNQNTFRINAQILRPIYTHRSYNLFIRVVSLMELSHDYLVELMAYIGNNYTKMTDVNTLRYVLNLAHQDKSFNVVIVFEEILTIDLLTELIKYDLTKYTSYQQSLELLNRNYKINNYHANKLIKHHKHRLSIFKTIINNDITYCLPNYDINITNIMQEYISYEHLNA